MTNLIILLEFGVDRKVRERVMATARFNGRLYDITDQGHIKIEGVRLDQDSGRVLDSKGNPAKYKVDGMDLLGFQTVG
jgi:hypothetical protein